MKLAGFGIFVIEETTRESADGMKLLIIQKELDLDVRELVAQLDLHLAHVEFALTDHGSNDIWAKIMCFESTVHTFSYSEAWIFVSTRLIADELSQLLHLGGAICEAAIQSTYVRFVKELKRANSNERTCGNRVILSS
jgi:hypothetical protein